jgi:hypothetical protein
VGPIRFGRTEFVVIVTCLGLLSTAAVPIYVDVDAANRRTEVRALAASIESAADLGYSLWRGSGQGARIEIASTPVRIINGYPTADGLARLLDEPGSTRFVYRSGAWSHRESAAGQCGVTYQPPAAAGAQPEISTQLAGC